MATVTFEIKPTLENAAELLLEIAELIESSRPSEEPLNIGNGSVWWAGSGTLHCKADCGQVLRHGATVIQLQGDKRELARLKALKSPMLCMYCWHHFRKGKRVA